MPGEPLPAPEDLAPQARQHPDSLFAAGVGWLPNPPLRAAPAAPEPPRPMVALRAPAELETGPVVQPLLFQGAALPGQAPATEVEQRLEALQELATRVSQCVRCKALASTRTQTVFGVGPL